MCLQLFLLSLVTISFAPQVLGATTTPPPQWNCTNALTAIWNCLNKHTQNKSRTTFNNYNAIYNMKGLTTLLTNLKSSGCIVASAWPDVQAWLKYSAPPKPLATIYNGLTPQQKTTLGEFENDWTNRTLQTQADNIEKIIGEKVQNLTQANQNLISNWDDQFWSACGAFYGEYYSSC